MRFIISPALLRRYIINMIPYRRPRRRYMVQSICWASPSDSDVEFFKRLPARFMETLPSTPRPRIIGEMSIRLDCAPATMRASGVRRRYSLTITANMLFKLRWRGYSILTDPECTRLTEGLYRIL